jgi:hypothetical protein
MPSVAVQAVLTDSLNELNVLGQGEAISADLAAFVLGRFNQLLDNWNAEREAVFVEKFDTFTFIANQQDYTIGPSGADFTTATNRPVSIEAANVILNNVTPNVQNPINLRDYQWWANLTVRSVTTTFPTDLYYAPDWPNGILHFWPKPTIAYGLELVYRNVLSQVALDDTINLPPGYQNALMLTLAEDVATPLSREVPAMTTKKAREARARIFSNNTFTPRLVTQDAGMPSNSRNRSAFNYRTGMNITVTR